MASGRPGWCRAHRGLHRGSCGARVAGVGCAMHVICIDVLKSSNLTCPAAHQPPERPSPCHIRSPGPMPRTCNPQAASRRRELGRHRRRPDAVALGGDRARPPHRRRSRARRIHRPRAGRPPARPFAGRTSGELGRHQRRHRAGGHALSAAVLPPLSRRRRIQRPHHHSAHRITQGASHHGRHHQMHRPHRTRVPPRPCETRRTGCRLTRTS